MKWNLSAVAACAVLVQQAQAWGADGHKIVATIAQIHLHPNTKRALCDILPPEADCHLAPIAAWADTIRGRHPETGPMHYINPLGDEPGQSCHYGDKGWTNDKVNVVTAIHEKTAKLMNGTRGRADDETLRYLVHFMGDIHQPLHLTGYLKGGNDAWVSFFGRRQKLHSVWDSSILLQKIAGLGNYTSPTSSRQIESALRGDRYDPYIRFIVKEGIWGWWKESSQQWFNCPEGGDSFPTNAQVPGLWQNVQLAKDIVLNALPNVIKSPLMEMEWIKPIIPGFSERASVSATESWSPACPYTWSKQIHPYNCKYAWPPGFVLHGPTVEIDDGEYLPALTRDKVLESLLAQGGIRLAAVLNGIYADEEQVGGFSGPWFDKDEAKGSWPWKRFFH